MGRQLPKRALNFLPVGAVRAQGWIAQQLRQDNDGFVGHFPEICEQAATDIFVDGRVAGGDNRHWWGGETEGKWIDGFTRIAHVLGDRDAATKVDSYLRRLVDHQDPDGYLGIYQRDWREANNRCTGDLWTQTFVLLSLLSQYEATGETAFLNAANRAALATIARNGPGGADQPFTGSAEESMVRAHNLLIVEPVLWLYEITADETLLDFARFCYEQYSSAELGWPESDGQLARISDPALPFIGHGAHTTAQLRVPLLLYYATRDPRYRTAYETGFAKMSECLTVTGACKSDEAIGAPDDPGAPLPGSGYEYCAMTELLHSLHLALVCSGDLSYAERAERLAFNAAQASRLHDGTAIGYFGADNQFVATRTAGSRWDYSPTHDDIAVCCNPSAARFLAHHVSRSVLRTEDDGLLIPFYGPMCATTVVRGTEVTIIVSTGFPFDDTVLFEVSAASPVRFPLRLRVPGWCTTMTVAVADATAFREDGIYRLDAEWSDQTVRVDFDAPIRAVTAADGTAAVERGPLVFALDIPVETTYTRDYPVPGYHDIDFTPATEANTDYALLLDADDSAALYHAELTRKTTAPDQFPWSCPPVRIAARALEPSTHTEEYYTAMERDLTMVPVGTTTLRRTCFPHVKRRHPARLPTTHYPMRESTP